MAYGYGYRYRRRPYRRGYRRYRRYGTSLRRYRSVQMNDNETKVMTFTSVAVGSVPVGLGNILKLSFPNLLNGVNQGDFTISPNAGRLFFAGMMFDRMRLRSLSCTIRPRVMPSSSATNYTLYASWDRYGSVVGAAGEPQGNGYSIQSDPSAKQVTWTPGGSGSALRTYIYSTSKDRYQYYAIGHATDLTNWRITTAVGTSGSSAPFFPVLMLAIDAITAPSTNPSVSILTRATIEFQGGFSSTTLNYTPASGASLSEFDAQSQVLRSLPESARQELYSALHNERVSLARDSILTEQEKADELAERIQKFQLENPD